MKSFITDEKNDFKIDEFGNLMIGENINAVVQLVQNAINTLKGEIQLNTTLGVPYFETVFNKTSPNISVWESYMIEEAEKCEGVVRVNKIQSKVKDNELTYEMEVLTQYGTAIITG